MTLTFTIDLGRVLKLNHLVKYLGSGHFVQTLLSGHTATQAHTHTEPIAIPGPLKWSVNRTRNLHYV